MLKQTLNQLGKLCIFKTTPQNLAYSMVTLYAVIAMNLVILTYSMSNQVGILLGVGVAAAFIAVLLGYIFLLLKGFKLQRRFVQTASSILGCNAVMMLLALVTTFILYGFMSHNIAVELVMILARVFVLIIFVWTLAIISYIFKCALERNWLIASLSAIFMLVAGNLAITILLHLLTQNMPIAN